MLAARWLYKKASRRSPGDCATTQQTAPISSIETNGPEQPTKATEKPSSLDKNALQPAQDVSVQEDESEKRQRRIYRMKLVVALFPCQFLGAVDATIVSTAMTTIASHFSEFNKFLIYNLH